VGYPRLYLCLIFVFESGAVPALGLDLSVIAVINHSRAPGL
jgi:hypothetical protein